MKVLNSLKNAYFYSFIVVGVFKVFCEKRFLVRSTSTGMYIEAPLDFFMDCSGLFILEICSTSVYHLENQQKLYRNKSAE